MPDKNHKPGCGSGCVRCWRNKLKHANPQVKKFLKKVGATGIGNDNDSVQNYVDNDDRPKKRQRAFTLKPKLVNTDEG
jgi:hypothetical protein